MQFSLSSFLALPILLQTAAAIDLKIWSARGCGGNPQYTAGLVHYGQCFVYEKPFGVGSAMVTGGVAGCTVYLEKGTCTDDGLRLTDDYRCENAPQFFNVKSVRVTC